MLKLCPAGKVGFAWPNVTPPELVLPEPTATFIEPQPFETEQMVTVAEPADPPNIETVAPFKVAATTPEFELVEM